MLAQAFTQLHSELLWEGGPAEKYFKLWSWVDFSAEFNPDVVLGAQSVLVPVWRAIKRIKGTQGTLEEGWSFHRTLFPVNTGRCSLRTALLQMVRSAGIKGFKPLLFKTQPLNTCSLKASDRMYLMLIL